VSSTCNYSPIVANLERAVDFYQLFGLDFGAVLVQAPVAPAR
jgi:hypothetical protein